LDRTDEDRQNDFLNGALEMHMAIEERRKTLCEVEEKKFYRGESSIIEKCNLGCSAADVEHQIVLYVSVEQLALVYICNYVMLTAPG